MSRKHADEVEDLVDFAVFRCQGICGADGLRVDPLVVGEGGGAARGDAADRLDGPIW